MSRSKSQVSFPLPVWLALAGIALSIILLLRLRYELALVVGRSMCPTLNPGNLLVVDKKPYRLTEPARGDVILARYRGELVIKRIVALPGEEVELKHGQLFINGVSKPENHLVEPGPMNIGKGTMLMGRFATLGDNRSVPLAQAIHPIISEENIVGKVVLSLGW